jgi:putative membrane protein
MSLVASSLLVADSDHWNGPGWWVIFPLLWFLFFATIVLFVVFRGRRWRQECGTRSGTARLAERYAAGEIDEQEYRERLSVLEENR